MTVHRSVNDSASKVSRPIMTSCINVIDLCVQAIA